MIAPAAKGALVSFTACLAFVPIVRAVCFRLRALDFPGPLKIHARPVPRLGGIAVALSIVAGTLVGARDGLGANAFFWGALGIIWIAGLADDLCDVSPYPRLAAQIASGTLLWFGGWRFLVGSSLPRTGAFALILLCGTVVLFANAFNFLDGSDGLASGVAAIIAIALLVISRGIAHAPLTVLVAACVAASSVAFLFYNFAPATIYLGDSGSTVLGFCVAFLVLSQPRAPHPAPSPALVILLVSALPVADFALAVLRRLRSRASVLRGDRLHLYDLMLARGCSSRTVALLYYAVTAALAVAARLSLQVGVCGRFVVSALSLGGVAAFAVLLGGLRGEERGMRPARRKIAAPNGGDRRLNFR